MTKNEIFKDYKLDEEDDIIIPVTYFGEIIYILFILTDILFNKNDRKKKFNRLKCQIRIFMRWKEVTKKEYENNRTPF